MKKILIWGTGKIADELLCNGIEGELTGFLETVRGKELYQGKKVFSVEEMPKDYDYILVANSYTDQIYQLCVDKGIDLEKVIFLRAAKSRPGQTDTEVIREILGVKNFTNYCHTFGLWRESFITEDMKTYESLNVRENFRIDTKHLWPIAGDRYAMAGAMHNYFWQDLWAARKIRQSGVERHFDIGSRIDGFIAHLLAMDIEVSLIDVRAFPGEVEHLHTIVDDATSLKQVADASVESMSALCSLEHFGLGRYGDPIDPEACFTCFANLQKKIKKGGRLYLSVPVGRERVEFNAHRVFYAQTIADAFSDLTLKEFSCAAERRIEYHVDLHKYDQDGHDGEYRYGLFYFVRE